MLIPIMHGPGSGVFRGTVLAPCKLAMLSIVTPVIPIYPARAQASPVLSADHAPRHIYENSMEA